MTGIGISLFIGWGKNDTPPGPPSLKTLTLSATTFTLGTPSSGTINGATTGSTITASDLPSGLTIDGAARTWSWSGTGSASTGSLTLTETLEGATGSPRDSVIGWTIADSTAPTLTSPTGTATGAETADLSVSTNEGNGTLYWYVSESATPPSAADLKAGTGAADAGNQAVTATGTQTASAGGLTAETSYYAHFLHRDAAGNDSAIVTSAGFETEAAPSGPIAVPVGALTSAGVRIAPTTGAAIASGDPNGHFAVSGGFLTVSSAGDAANLSGSPYSLTMDDGQEFTVTAEAGAYDVASQAEWDTVIALAAATLFGKKIYVQPDSFRSGSAIVTGVNGVAIRLRRADFGGLTIEGRVPALAGMEPTGDRVTVDKFYLRGTRNVTFRHLATTPVAETKFNLTGEAANHLYGITIDQCHVSGAVGDPNGDYSTSSNYPNNNTDLITSGASHGNAVGTIALTSNLVEWGGSNINIRVDRDSTSTFEIHGNVVRYFYDDGIGLATFVGTATAWNDCVANVTDNFVYGNIGRSTDSDNPHTDAIRFIANYLCQSDWTINVHRNRVFVGNSRGNGHLQGILASDFKSTGGDSGHFYKGSAIGNVIVSDNGITFNIENAKDFTALNNTVVNNNVTDAARLAQIMIGTGSTHSTTSGTHRVERNISDAFSIGGSPELTDNITLGNMGATIAYTTVFDGGDGDWPYPDTLTELMTWFSRKTGGPADLADGPPDAGAIGSGAVTWPANVPGTGGGNLVS